MTSDSYWFRHNANRSRQIDLLKIRAIYDYWGIGLYWSILEYLREQEEYKCDASESGLQLLAGVLFCEENKFNNYINDCKKYGIFRIESGFLVCDYLLQNMQKWEIKKRNGSERKAKPKRNGKRNRSEIVSEPISETEANGVANAKHKIIEDKITEDKIIKEKKEKDKEKEREFINSLQPHLEKYGKNMLNDFYRYWGEWNQSGTKMRWQLQKTWEISKRLTTWANRENKFKNEKNESETTVYTGKE